MKKSITLALSVLIPLTANSQVKQWSDLTPSNLFDVNPDITYQIECKIGRDAWRSKTPEEQSSFKEEFYNTGQYQPSGYGADEIAQLIFMNLNPMARLVNFDTYQEMKSAYDQGYFCLDEDEAVKKDLEMLRSNDRRCIAQGYSRYSYNRQGCVNTRRR